MALLYPEPQYGGMGYPGNQVPFSARNPINAGIPAQGEIDAKFPYGGIPRMFTHQSVYNEPKEIVNRAFIAFFDRPDPILQLVLPVFPHEGEQVNWKEFHAKIRTMPQHSNKAPLETYEMTATNLKFDMQWHGLAFAIDDSILGTPAADFLLSAYCNVLQSCMNLTIFVEVMGHINNQPDMIARELDFCTRHRANQMSKECAIRRQIDLMELLPGILDKGDSTTNALGYLMEHIGVQLDGFKVDPALKPNFFLLSSLLSESLMTDAPSLVDSGLSEYHITKFLRDATAQNDLMYTINPLVIRKFRGLSLITVDPYGSAEGRRDLMSRTYIDGTSHVIDTWTVWRQDIIDYERRAYVKIFEHGSDVAKQLVRTAGGIYNVMSKWNAGAGGHHVPDQGQLGNAQNHLLIIAAATQLRAEPATIYNTFGVAHVKTSESHIFLATGNTNSRFVVAFRPGVTLNMHMIVEGIGGRATGLTAIGRDTTQSYSHPSVETHFKDLKFRIGVCVAHPEHFVVLPHAKHRDYVRGGSARLAPAPNNAPLDICALNIGLLLRGAGAFSNPATDTDVLADTEAAALVLGSSVPSFMRGALHYYSGRRGNDDGIGHVPIALARPAAGDTADGVWHAANAAATLSFSAQANANNTDVAVNVSARNQAFGKVLKATYYGCSFNSTRANRAQKMSSDVFMYLVPTPCATPVDESSIGTRLLCAGGTFEDKTLSTMDDFRWISQQSEYGVARQFLLHQSSINGQPDPLNAAGEGVNNGLRVVKLAEIKKRNILATNLQSRVELSHIHMHGLNNYANEKCWVSKSRYQECSELNDESKFHFTPDGHGPWRHLGEHAMDVFQNHPRAAAPPIRCAS